jgi:O-antigen/teichoic acid export membrane protein
VAATLIALAQAVRDFGVGQYIVQEKELNAERIRSAFTVTLIVAVILAAITASLCTVAADFYREPGVRNVMLVLALNFLLIPFGQITLGYLQREMKFGAIAQVKIGSTIVHFRCVH